LQTPNRGGRNKEAGMTVVLSQSSPPCSPVSDSERQIQPLTTSPQLIAMRARIAAEWKDLVYREALRMSGALRQILANSNNASRTQLVSN
jgi:hypothetical protein